MPAYNAARMQGAQEETRLQPLTTSVPVRLVTEFPAPGVTRGYASA